MLSDVARRRYVSERSSEVLDYYVLDKMFVSKNAPHAKEDVNAIHALVSNLMPRLRQEEREQVLHV